MISTYLQGRLKKKFDEFMLQRIKPYLGVYSGRWSRQSIEKITRQRRGNQLVCIHKILLLNSQVLFSNSLCLFSLTSVEERSLEK